MSKIHKLVIISCITASTLAMGVSVYASRAKRFVDHNGNEIIVQSSDHLSANFDDVSSSRNTVIEGSDNPQIGDILIVNNVREKVIALGDNGEFITDIAE